MSSSLFRSNNAYDQNRIDSSIQRDLRQANACKIYHDRFEIGDENQTRPIPYVKVFNRFKFVEAKNGAKNSVSRRSASQVCLELHLIAATVYRSKLQVSSLLIRTGELIRPAV